MIHSILGFFHQSYAPGDIGIVLFLVLLEGLLSADNALVLAIMVKHLPKGEQQKALLYGLAGAFVFRFLAIILASYIIGLWWLQLVGAGYLLFVAVKHFFIHTARKDARPAGGGLWQTVAAVEVADIAFAVDSVLAAVATVNLNENPDKIWVVYLGAILGVVLLRFAAGLFIKLLDRFPDLDHMAYSLVGWVGVKLLFMSGHNFSRKNPAVHVHIPEMDPRLFWSVMAVLIVAGSLFAVSRGSRRRQGEPEAEGGQAPAAAPDFSPAPDGEPAPVNKEE